MKFNDERSQYRTAVATALRSGVDQHEWVDKQKSPNRNRRLSPAGGACLRVVDPWTITLRVARIDIKTFWWHDSAGQGKRSEGHGWGLGSVW